MEFKINDRVYGAEELIVCGIEILAQIAVYETAMTVFENTLGTKGKIASKILKLGCRVAALGFGTVAVRGFDRDYKAWTHYAERLEKRMAEREDNEPDEEVESDG